MKCKRKPQAPHSTCQVMVPIAGLGRTEDNRFEVIEAATGRAVFVPRSITQVFPGRIYVPEWFYSRVFRNANQRGGHDHKGRAHQP